MKMFETSFLVGSVYAVEVIKHVSSFLAVTLYITNYLCTAGSKQQQQGSQDLGTKIQLIWSRLPSLTTVGAALTTLKKSLLESLG